MHHERVPEIRADLEAELARLEEAGAAIRRVMAGNVKGVLSPEDAAIVQGQAATQARHRAEEQILAYLKAGARTRLSGLTGIQEGLLDLLDELSVDHHEGIDRAELEERAGFGEPFLGVALEGLLEAGLIGGFTVNEVTGPIDAIRLRAPGRSKLGSLQAARSRSANVGNVLAAIPGTRSEPFPSAAREPGSSGLAGLDRLHDVFICHASEDKETVARPLAAALQARGWTVWLDELKLQIGDSLRRAIDEGIRTSRYGAVIMSPSFFAKSWPQYELDGLADRELSEGNVVVMPVWHGVGHDDVAAHSPSLAAKYAANTSQGIDAIADMIGDRLEGHGHSRQQGSPVGQTSASARATISGATSVFIDDLRTAQQRGVGVEVALLSGQTYTTGVHSVNEESNLFTLYTPRTFGDLETTTRLRLSDIISLSVTDIRWGPPGKL